MQRQGEYRNPQLLAMVRQLPCQCGRITCQGGRVEASHSNQLAHGKGKALKAHDCFVAALGSECHFAIDNGSQLDDEQRTRIWAGAWRSTFAILHVVNKIVLPTIDYDELAKLTGGHVNVVLKTVPSVVALPGTVPDEVWLEYWQVGRARASGC